MQRNQAPTLEPLRLAAAIVVHYDRILLVQRSGKEGFLPRRWGIPCGKLDGDEEPRRGVLRELREETGLAGTVIKYAGHQTFRSDWMGREVENLQDNFLVSPSGVDEIEFPDIDPPETDQGWEWVPIDMIETFGLDLHNLTAIRQGLRARSVKW
ncbi:MAG TPA: NUDIX domain-containing protein [Streptosporangiaceae bacterium]|jgi:8-oxo-dGTP pyrophosphatase MutT (NUDIX family)|nr:NUDIX domain-containing protein [Streptosporangiaceae bacterium]